MDEELYSCLNSLESFISVVESEASLNTEDINLAEGLSRRCDEFIQLMRVLSGNKLHATPPPPPPQALLWHGLGA